MIGVLPLLLSAILTFGFPVDHNSDDSVLSVMNLREMANIMMSSEMVNTSDQSLKASNKLKTGNIHSSHLIEASKDLSFGSVLLPLETMVESSAGAAAISAAAAVKGTVKGSAIATPIILKSVALPGLAAGVTAAFMSVPNLILERVNHFPPLDLQFNNMKTSVEESAHNFANLFIVEEMKTPIKTENDSSIDLKEGIENVAKTVEALKVGALGMATKGLVIAKNGAHVAGRIILKPIAILTGVHLKMLGSGLALGGKLVGGTGAGIAKVGTIVKFAGLGSIGLGASAIGWGLDKSTIDIHFRESDLKFKV